jgi:tungstate transport system substrate-binding protein
MVPRSVLKNAALVCGLLASLLAPPVAAERTIRLATTTSTENSGLLKVLLPHFERDTGYKVHVIAVGTGKALRMGRDGDVDVVLVHAPAAERQFVADGHGIERRYVMYNDFVIVGPRADPAGIRDMPDAAVALARVAARHAPFVSRGDDSGTHQKELALWDTAGIKPTGKWYREAGQGMEQVLRMAGEFDGYTLADRGTWLALRKKLTLNVLVQGDARLFNPYGVIAVNPARYPDTNYAGAMALINWLTSPRGRTQIADFKINGESLFVPMAMQARGTTDR